mmetsp:Transcript_32951/g.83456  ORF Transcript_32951/g.83456 Transcript_32951/m.83456 type:complete len:306 (-) Transcript_32951:444-1361(-)
MPTPTSFMFCSEALLNATSSHLTAFNGTFCSLAPLKMLCWKRTSSKAPPVICTSVRSQRPTSTCLMVTSCHELRTNTDPTNLEFSSLELSTIMPGACNSQSSAPTTSTSFHLESLQSASLALTEVRLTRSNLAPNIRACVRSAPTKLQSVMIDFSKFACDNLAPLKSVLWSSTPWRLAPERSAPRRSMRRSRTPGVSMACCKSTPRASQSSQTESASCEPTQDAARNATRESCTWERSAPSRRASARLTSVNFAAFKFAFTNSEPSASTRSSTTVDKSERSKVVPRALPPCMQAPVKSELSSFAF